MAVNNGNNINQHGATGRVGRHPFRDKGINMKMTKTMGALLLALALPVSLQAQEVFNWRDGKGVNNYSDVPRNLQPNRSNILNVNTQTVRNPPPVAPVAGAVAASDSLADQQARLNQQIAEQNRKTEEQNRKIDEENKRNKEANCQRARLNRTAAESARAANRAELLARYDADVQQYCN